MEAQADGLTPWTRAVVKGIVRQFKEDVLDMGSAQGHIIVIFYHTKDVTGQHVYPPWTKDQICDYVERLWNDAD